MCRASMVHKSSLFPLSTCQTLRANEPIKLQVNTLNCNATNTVESFVSAGLGLLAAVLTSNRVNDCNVFQWEIEVRDQSQGKKHKFLTNMLENKRYSSFT